MKIHQYRSHDSGRLWQVPQKRVVRSKHPVYTRTRGAETRVTDIHIHTHIIRMYISGRPRALRRGDGLDQRGGDSPSIIDFARHPQPTAYVKTGRGVALTLRARAISRRVTRVASSLVPSTPPILPGRIYREKFSPVLFIAVFQVPDGGSTSFRPAQTRWHYERRTANFFPFFPCRRFFHLFSLSRSNHVLRLRCVDVEFASYLRHERQKANYLR